MPQMTSKNHKILAVDDNDMNLAVLKKLLKDYNLKCASNGEEALDIASSFYPDLVILDIMMPGIDGYEVMSNVKTHDATD